MRTLIALGLLGLPLAVQAGCEGGERLFEYRSIPPLLAAEYDRHTEATVYASGCVDVHFPAYDTRAGRYQLRLDPSQLRELRLQVQSSGLGQVDPAQLRRAIDQQLKATQPETVYTTADENIIELRWSAMDKSQPAGELRWATLHRDQLNAPGNPDLGRIRAAAALFDQLLETTRRKAEAEAQP